MLKIIAIKNQTCNIQYTLVVDQMFSNDTSDLFTVQLSEIELVLPINSVSSGSTDQFVKSHFYLTYRSIIRDGTSPIYWSHISWLYRSVLKITPLLTYR